MKKMNANWPVLQRKVYSGGTSHGLDPILISEPTTVIAFKNCKSSATDSDDSLCVITLKTVFKIL